LIITLYITKQFLNFSSYATDGLIIVFSLSSSSLETATSGTQEKCLPLLPSGSDGVHIHLLRRAVPRLQKDKMAERAGFEPTKHRVCIGFVRHLVMVLMSAVPSFCICLKASTTLILAYIPVDFSPGQGRGLKSMLYDFGFFSIFFCR
jgi:hypothetical protein